MQSHYEINVSLNGHHLFATAPRSCVTESDMKLVLAEIAPRFPAGLGFKVSVTRWECVGRDVDIGKAAEPIDADHCPRCGAEHTE